MTWRIKVRRFRCLHCTGRTFVERVPGFARARARRSDRLAAAQGDIGLVLGGEAGARLSRRLAMPVSGDTVLRLVRRSRTTPGPLPRVVGVDDWAWRRGRCFVPYRRAADPSQLDRHRSFVEARWCEGQRNATALHREMQTFGFTGGYDIVWRWAARQRRGEPARPPSARIPSTRRITRWLVGDPATLDPETRRFTEALRAAAPGLRTAAEHVRAFADLLRLRHPAGLDPWLDAVAVGELRGFAAGLRQDAAAVRAAMAEPWSNGPIEGPVNRLKLIKRSMYGRAKFDLLRQRVLLAA